MLAPIIYHFRIKTGYKILYKKRKDFYGCEREEVFNFNSMF